MGSQNQAFISHHIQIGYLWFILLIGAVTGSPVYSAPQQVGLGGTWSEYDPKFFGAGIQTLSNQSSSGFTSTLNGSVSDYLERPKVYQEFDGVEVSQVGQKITATFDLQFNTLPDLGDTIFRFGFGDRTTNQGLVPLMVDLQQTAGQLAPEGSGEPNSASMRMRYDDSITDDATAFADGDYSGFLSASDSFTHGKGNPTSPDDSAGTGGIRDTVHVHTFTVSAERVERNVDTSFPLDGIADEVANGWYTTLSWTSTEPNAQTAFAEPNTGGLVDYDVDTGLPVYLEEVFTRERIENIDTLGFTIYTDDPFSNNGSLGSYTISNFVVEYDDGVALGGDYNDDGAVNAADYTVWRDTLGSTTDLAADGDGSEVIDQADYDFWVQNYGNLGSGAGISTSVPEPSSFFFVLVASTLAASRRK